MNVLRLFFLWFAAAAYGQQLGVNSEPIFPQDNANPAKAGGAAMMHAVCPGHEARDGSVGCTACPDDFGTPGPVKVGGIIRGHFLSAKGDDATVSISGCDWKAGVTSYLLSKQSGEWRQMDRVEDTSLCHKVRLKDGRDALVCLTSFGWRLGTTYRLTYTDFKGDGSRELIQTFDSSPMCGIDSYEEYDSAKPLPVWRSFISSVAFQKRLGSPDDIYVEVSSGELMIEPDNCNDKTVIPITEKTQIRLSWTGAGYEQAK